MINTETRLPRVALGNTSRTVPQADVAAYEAYEASPQAAIDTAASFERERLAMEAEAAELGEDW